MRGHVNYWQIGSGSYGRDYAEDFLRYGLAFAGGDVQRATMAKVNVGDRILMKKGMSQVLAAGEVVERDGRHRGEGDREWLRDFDGWDLRAYCFVDWREPKKPRSAKGLTRATIQRVRQPELRKLVDDIVATGLARRTLDREPDPTQTVEDDEILEFLIRQGLRPGSAEDLTSTFNRIRLLAGYYYGREHDADFSWDDVREHETRTFLVIPLLLALGWAEQQIKIELPVKKERRRADVACFARPYARNDEDCVLIVETKGFSQGLHYASDQGKAYAREFPNCQVVLVSNRYCYKAYRREKGGAFSESPSAYLNILRPKDRYPLDPHNVDGCLEAMRLLLPASSR